MAKRLLVILMGASMLVALFFGSANVEVSAELFDSPVPEPPINDDFYGAIVIQTLPFTDYRDTSYATWSPDDPYDCYSNGSVWYAFTPETDMVLEANTSGSSYDTTLAAYTGTLGALSLVPGACNDDYNGLQSRVSFQASAGTTYYFLVGFCCGWGSDGGGSLVLTVGEILPPPNDDFANATGVSGIPFTDNTTTEGATVQSDEPMPGCVYDNPGGSIWYAFTPSESGSAMAEAQGFDTYLGIYTGTSLGDLTPVDSRCGYWPNRLAFQASAGETYHIQVGGMWGQAGTLEFNLLSTPPPEVYFYYYPSPPSIYSTVQFYESCSDPAYIGIETYEWDLGDGTTATGCCPTHDYAADGDYTVELVVTTYDGRTGSASQTVQVQTHDVAITEFRTPKRAEVGETARIVVGLSNQGLYNENVYLQLYKSVPGGYWEEIGYAYGQVPAHRANRTVDFEFAYMFTDEDAAAKSVSFRAEASLNQWLDAQPTDNEAISLPTMIKPLH
ncbi:MAG: PKD domain-containing protein [Anaerolineae bacterium]